MLQRFFTCTLYVWKSISINAVNSQYHRLNPYLAPKKSDYITSCLPAHPLCLKTLSHLEGLIQICRIDFIDFFCFYHNLHSYIISTLCSASCLAPGPGEGTSSGETPQGPRKKRARVDPTVESVCIISYRKHCEAFMWKLNSSILFLCKALKSCNKPECC